eukprot:scaffold38901_cov65-Cyclotella_meneghiniana.AAC.1
MAVVRTTVATAGSETTIDSFCGFREGQQVDGGSERSKKQKDWKRAKKDFAPTEQYFTTAKFTTRSAAVSLPTREW